MGCDIHAHIEVRTSEGGWSHLCELFIWRNYTVFAKLADVRNDGHIRPIAPARGFPEDVSYRTAERRKDWTGEAHHDSWLTLEELTHSYWVDAGERCRGFVHGVIPYIRYVSEGSKENEVRVAFWFDN